MLILEAKHLKILREYRENKEKLSQFSEKLKSLEYIYMHSSKEIKTKYYEILIRILSIYSETEALQLINELPSEISDDIIISSFEMSIKINNHNVTEEEVIDFCHKTGQYLLMNDYINAQQFDNVKIKKLLDENKIFIRKDLSLFILYVQAIRKIDGNSEVQKIKECYKKEYGNYLEYYLVTLDDSSEESFKNTLNDVVNMWYSDQLLCYYYDSEVKFVQILLNNSKFSEGLDVIKKLETIGLTNSLITKYKAKILIKQQKFIDALTLLSSNFDMYKEDTEIIDSILVISFHNAREVLDDVIESALKIRTPRLLMLVSNILVSKSKFSEARTLITEALLKSPNATEICEQYLMIHTQDPSKEIPMVKGVQVDTTLYLSCGTTHLIYCIHKNGFLASEPYFWENSIHISEDTCICMNLLNKKIGDKINMNDLEYTIDEIIPTEVYLSRLCIEMMIKKGTAKAFHADIKEEEFCNIEEFKSWIKENIGTNNILNEFMEKYNDLSQTPLPLYLIHKASQLTYSELIIAFLEDKDIIFRESVHNDCGSENGYMLTTAAVIVLYKLGVNIDFLNENNVYIPNSIATQIEQDVEKIITSNKREHKSRMFFINNDIYTDEASDEEKQKNLVQSVNLKKYVKKLKTINNNSDIVLDGNNAITCREGLGICDCDSISISMKENYKLVCAEAAVIGLASYFKLNSSCIIDFLCEIKTPLLDLIHYMKKMIDYKFFITVTPYSFDYILNNFCSLNQEEQQLFLQKLDEYFTNIQSQDEKYKQSCTLIFNDAIRTHINNNGGIAHTPLSEIMIPHMLILNKLEIELQISENGDVKTMFYRTNSKSSAKSDS